MMLFAQLATAPTRKPPPMQAWESAPKEETYQSGQTKGPLIDGSGDTDILRHPDFAEKPCLAFDGYARTFTSNANLFDQVYPPPRL
jgi:hypothetical protein